MGCFKNARAFPFWEGNMVLVKTKRIRAGKKPCKKLPLRQNVPKTHDRVEVQTWYPRFDNVHKLRLDSCGYKKTVSPTHFRVYHP